MFVNQFTLSKQEMMEQQLLRPAISRKLSVMVVYGWMSRGVNRVYWRYGLHPILLWIVVICQWLEPCVSFDRHVPMDSVEFLRRKNVLLGE
jgi:hypothetical protein